MLLSKSCEYGLRAALYLALQKRKDYVSIRRMSEKLDISFHFLTKILQQLTAAGLMESFKGPKGGIRLAQPADKIHLIEIVEAIDGSDLFTECVLGLPGCGQKKPCALHDRWMNQREGIKKMLQNATLAKLSAQSKLKHLRITADGGLAEL